MDACLTSSGRRGGLGRRPERSDPGAGAAPARGTDTARARRGVIPGSPRRRRPQAVRRARRGGPCGAGPVPWVPPAPQVPPDRAPHRLTEDPARPEHAAVHASPATRPATGRASPRRPRRGSTGSSAGRPSLGSGRSAARRRVPHGSWCAAARRWRRPTTSRLGRSRDPSHASRSPRGANDCWARIAGHGATRRARRRACRSPAPWRRPARAQVVGRGRRTRSDRTATAARGRNGGAPDAHGSAAATRRNSSSVKARSVSLRTFPSRASASIAVAAVCSSGASKTST